MAKKKIIILGAGLAGLSAAWHLQERGVDCLVFEKEQEAGGLCRSKNIGGFTFDYDGHLLHFRHAYAFGLVKKLLGNRLVEHQRSAWVYSGGSFTRYPFQANLYGLPSTIVKECLLGLIEAKKNNGIKDKGNLNFHEWINLTFGKGIARHFMVPYNTKFWTLPPRELNCAWLDGFIPVPSLTQTIEGAIEENRREFGYNARFWYPAEGGIESLPKAFANRIRNINTGCEIRRINLEKKEVVAKSGFREKFDYLISTIPLPELRRIIEPMPKNVHSAFGMLRWNSIFNLNLGMERKRELKRHWIYFPQRDLCFFRVGFFHNFLSGVKQRGKGSLYIEVSYSRNNPLDKKKIVSRILNDLEKAGVVFRDDKICVQDVNDIEYGYPIYDKNYRMARENILSFLAENSVIPCGRYGSWRYMSMEDALLDGKDAALAYLR